MTKGNEPAFASVAFGPCGESHGQDGLTKREYFAALAMQGLVSTLTISRREILEVMSETAVMYADALIAALNQTPAASGEEGK